MPETDYWIDNINYPSMSNDTRPSLFQSTSQPAPQGYSYQEIPNDADMPGPPQYQLIQNPTNPYTQSNPPRLSGPVQMPDDLRRGGVETDQPSPDALRNFGLQNRWASDITDPYTGQSIFSPGGNPQGLDLNAILMHRMRDLGGSKLADYMQNPYPDRKRPPHAMTKIEYMNRQGQPFNPLDTSLFASGMGQDPRQMQANLQDFTRQFGGIRQTYQKPSTLSQVMRGLNTGVFSLAGGLVGGALAGPIMAGATAGGVGGAMGSGGDYRAALLGAGTGALAGAAAPYLNPYLGQTGSRLVTDMTGAALRSGIQNKGTPNPVDVGVAGAASLVGSGIRAAIPSNPGPFINTPGEPGGGFTAPGQPPFYAGPLASFGAGAASATGQDLYDDARRKRRNPYIR